MYSFVRATAAMKSFFAVRCFTLSLPVLSGFRGQVRQRLRQALLQLVEALDSAIICSGRVAARHVCRDHQPDLLAHVIEGQHLVEEEQTGVGNAQLVLGASGSRSIWRTAS